MPIQLIRLDACPSEIALTKIGSLVNGGAFFLDFSRPLQRLRCFGIQNSWFGPTLGLLVPVVHEGERVGGFVVSCQRGEPYFDDIQALWKARYPSKRSPPIEETDPLQLVSDFATQFPEDSR